MSNKVKSINEPDFTPQGKVFPSPRDWRDQFIRRASFAMSRFREPLDGEFTPPVAFFRRLHHSKVMWQFGGRKGTAEGRLEGICRVGTL